MYIPAMYPQTLKFFRTHMQASSSLTHVPDSLESSSALTGTYLALRSSKDKQKPKSMVLFGCSVCRSQLAVSSTHARKAAFVRSSHPQLACRAAAGAPSNVVASPVDYGVCSCPRLELLSMHIPVGMFVSLSRQADGRSLSISTLSASRELHNKPNQPILLVSSHVA